MWEGPGLAKECGVVSAPGPAEGWDKPNHGEMTGIQLSGVFSGEQSREGTGCLPWSLSDVPKSSNVNELEWNHPE